MTTKKKGFTLIEILSVIVILAVIFLFITPRMIKQINNGKDTETKLIEQRVLSAAKEYVNNHDADFYKKLVNVGDVNYIYKSELLETGLISETDVEELTNFTAVKGKLLTNDKIEYTVEYINNPTNHTYTNDELYLMIEELRGQCASNTSVSNLLDKNNINNIMLKSYPVGSVYVSINNTNPGTLFGGTWVSVGSGRVLQGADETHVGDTTIEAGLPNITGYVDPRWNDNSGGGIIMYSQNNENNALSTSRPSDHGYWWANKDSSGAAGANTHYHTRINFDASRSSSIYGNSTTVQPPAYVVYMWKRTA